MRRAKRGEGTFVAIGFPVAAVLALAVWLTVHGTGIGTSWTAAAVLIILAGLADRVNVLTSPRTHLSPAISYIAAAALVGGPVVGALAGFSLELDFPVREVWRKRLAYGGAEGLQGFLIGLLGTHLVVHGGWSAFVVALVALLFGLALNLVWMAVISYDRRLQLGPELRQVWRPMALVSLVFPVLPLAAFLYLFQSASWLALGLSTFLLVALWAGNSLRLRLEQRLADERQRANHDALTGAPNRYALTDAIAAEHARIKRGGRNAALCFLDLDWFRKVNNSLGYQAGDQLLVAVYERLRSRLRTTDMVFRWGGEEFVVLAPLIDEDDLYEFADRLRLLIADEPFMVNDRERQVTCSVGAALLDEWQEPAEVLEAASRLVRVAKERRNAVEVAEQLARF